MQSIPVIEGIFFQNLRSFHTQEGKGMKWEHSQPCKIKCTVRKGASQLTEDGALLHSSLTFPIAVLSWHQRGQVYPGLCDSTALWYQTFNSTGSWLPFSFHWELCVSITSQQGLTNSHTKAKWFLKASDLSWLDFRASSLKYFQPQGCTAAMLLTGAIWRKSGCPKLVKL